MKSPAEEAKFLITLDNIWDIASATLFEKYIIENLRGYSKLKEIDSTDQESLYITLNGGMPVPGMIYTFIYKGPEMFIELNDSRIRFKQFCTIYYAAAKTFQWAT